jgi:hypothetical protein
MFPLLGTFFFSEKQKVEQKKSCRRKKWRGKKFKEQKSHLLKSKLRNSYEHLELRPNRLHQSPVGLQKSVELLVCKPVDQQITSSSGSLLCLEVLVSGRALGPSILPSLSLSLFPPLNSPSLLVCKPVDQQISSSSPAAFSA